MDEDKILAAVKRHVVTVMPDLDPELNLDGVEARRSWMQQASIAPDSVTMAMEELAITVPVMEFRKVTNNPNARRAAAEVHMKGRAQSGPREEN